ncbi:MAG: hypothetical protein MK101_11685 [Phycisphaerales bacterium]|nr:hypothetical protein [Phycisphaerales bacterium]
MPTLFDSLAEAPAEQADRVHLALRVTNAAGGMVMDSFNEALAGTLDVTDKADGSPVTSADCEAEALMRAVIGSSFPEDGHLGEERGEQEGTSGWRWVIDPIDGTVSFMHGVPVFGLLVGIEHDGEPVAGVMHFPGLDETVWATEAGAFWRRGDDDPVQARVSRTRKLDHAMVCMTSLDYMGDDPEPWLRVHRAVRRTRGWSDCHSSLLLATGRVDAVIEPELNPWDISAIIAVLRQAGGRFTDWNGERAFDSSVTRALSSNGHLHEGLLQQLKG